MSMHCQKHLGFLTHFIVNELLVVSRAETLSPAVYHSSTTHSLRSCVWNHHWCLITPNKQTAVIFSKTCFTCDYVFMSVSVGGFGHVWVQVSSESRRGYQIPWSWNYRWLWITMWSLGIEHRSHLSKPPEVIFLNCDKGHKIQNIKSAIVVIFKRLRW